MMPTDAAQWSELLTTLHDSPVTIALVAAGGGSGAIHQCFQHAGASRTFVEAVIPYSRAAMVEYLGGPPIDASASLPTARQLAARARQRAERLCDEDDQRRRWVGVALVAALPTDTPRRGGDRIHVAWASIDGGRQWSLTLAKDSCTRAEAETISDEMMFLALASLVDGISQDRFFRQTDLPIQATL